METSAGVLITDEENILLGHVTLSSRYDIPKGKIEDNESPIDAVIRETKEETGLDLNIGNLLDLGEFKYLKNKNLHLFKYKMNEIPLNLKCTSYFERYGKEYPEFDGFKIVPIKDVQSYISLNLYKVIKSILNSRT